MVGSFKLHAMSCFATLLCRALAPGPLLQLLPVTAHRASAASNP